MYNNSNKNIVKIYFAILINLRVRSSQDNITVWDSYFRFRLGIKARDSCLRFRFAIQVYDSYLGYRFWIQVLDSGFGFRFRIKAWDHVGIQVWDSG